MYIYNLEVIKFQNHVLVIYKLHIIEYTLEHMTRLYSGFQNVRLYSGFQKVYRSYNAL